MQRCGNNDLGHFGRPFNVIDLRRAQGARCRFATEEELVRSAGVSGDVCAWGRMGACSRTVFSASLEGGVESSTKILLGERGEAKFGCRVSSGRRRVLVDGWNRATGVAAARMAESMSQGDGCVDASFS
jgi:hypothetical protein